MGERVKKYAIVIFLTLLVWAWAFNELESTVTRSATLVLSKNTNSDIFVTLAPQAPIEMNLQFKGTPDKITDLINRIDAGQEDLEFKFNPENEKKASPYTLDILDFLGDHSKIRKLELNVLTSSVEFVTVRVENLVKLPLKIKCVDENGAEIKAENIEPSIVHIYARDGYTGEATVVLSQRDITAARKDYVIRKPFVELAPNDRRVGEQVRIELPSEDLPDSPVQPTRIGYSMSENLIGKYKIEVQNKSDIVRTLVLKATADALETYKSQQVHIFIVALDGDEKNDGIITRAVKFNFSLDDVANGRIRLAKDEQREAKFKLVKLPQTPSD